MTECHLLPPAAEACLCQWYPSSQKGGTLIAEDVHDLATHERRLEDPDSYRPACCPRCGSGVHIHDLRPRVLHGEPEVATEVIRFRCSDRERCGAAWRILPAWLARFLWGSWSRVEGGVKDSGSTTVSPRTRRRWKTRLTSSARLLIVVLSTATDGLWAALAAAVGLDARRSRLVQGYCAARKRGAPSAPFAPGVSFAELAGAIQRLSPGVRLM